MVFATRWVIRGSKIRDSRQILKRDNGLYIRQPIESDFFEPEDASAKLVAVDRSYLKYHC